LELPSYDGVADSAPFAASDWARTITASGINWLIGLEGDESA
jgi:hypothetical protein